MALLILLSFKHHVKTCLNFLLDLATPMAPYPRLSSHRIPSLQDLSDSDSSGLSQRTIAASFIQDGVVSYTSLTLSANPTKSATINLLFAAEFQPLLTKQGRRRIFSNLLENPNPTSL